MTAMILISTKMNEINPEQRSEEIFENFWLIIPKNFWQNLLPNFRNIFAEVINCEAQILEQIDYTLRIPPFYSYLKFLVFANVLDHADVPYQRIFENKSVGTPDSIKDENFPSFSQNYNSPNQNLVNFWSQKTGFSKNFSASMQIDQFNSYKNGKIQYTMTKQINRR